jgi:hypothetical protein
MRMGVRLADVAVDMFVLVLMLMDVLMLMRMFPFHVFSPFG